MKKLITAINSVGVRNTVNISCLREVDTEVWEYDGMELTEERIEQQGKQLLTDDDGMELTVSYSRLDKEGLKSLIQVFKDILEEKVEERKTYDQVKWLINPARLCFSSRYYPDENDFMIDITAQNKYRKHFKYGKTPGGGGDYIPEIHDDFYGTPETWGGNTLIITEENLKKYINDLKEELERDEK